MGKIIKGDLDLIYEKYAVVHPQKFAAKKELYKDLVKKTSGTRKDELEAHLAAMEKVK